MKCTGPVGLEEWRGVEEEREGSNCFHVTLQCLEKLYECL